MAPTYNQHSTSLSTLASTPSSVAEDKDTPNFLARQIHFVTDTTQVPIEREADRHDYDGEYRLNGGAYYSLPVPLIDSCLARGYIHDYVEPPGFGIDDTCDTLLNENTLISTSWDLRILVWNF